MNTRFYSLARSPSSCFSYVYVRFVRRVADRSIRLSVAIMPNTMTTMTMRLTKIAIIHARRATLGPSTYTAFCVCFCLFFIFVQLLLLFCCCRGCTSLLSISNTMMCIWVSQSVHAWMYSCVFLYSTAVHLLWNTCMSTFWSNLYMFIHSNKQTNTHGERSLCAVLIWLWLVFVSFRFITIHSILLLRFFLSLFCTNTYAHSPRFDHFGQSLYSLSLQFVPCDHFVSFAHIIRLNSVNICAMCVRLNNTERRTHHRNEKRKRTQHTHSGTAIRWAAYIHTCVCAYFIMMWIEWTTRDRHHSFASMWLWIEQIARDWQRRCVQKRGERS